MKVKIEIEMADADFQDIPNELRTILQKVVYRIEYVIEYVDDNDYYNRQDIKDSNNNNCGFFELDD